MEENKIFEEGSANNLGEMNRVSKESEQQNCSRDFGTAEGVNNQSNKNNDEKEMKDLKEEGTVSQEDRFRLSINEYYNYVTGKIEIIEPLACVNPVEDEDSVLGFKLPWIEEGSEFIIDLDNEVTGEICDVVQNAQPKGAQIVNDYSWEILTGVLNVIKSRKGKDRYNYYDIEEWEPNDDFTRLDIYIGDRYANKSATFHFTNLGFNRDAYVWWENVQNCAGNYYPKYNQYCFGKTPVADAMKNGDVFWGNNELTKILIDIALDTARYWVKAHYYFMEESFFIGENNHDMTDEFRSFFWNFEKLPDITVTIFTD